MLMIFLLCSYPGWNVLSTFALAANVISPTLAVPMTLMTGRSSTPPSNWALIGLLNARAVTSRDVVTTFIFLSNCFISIMRFNYQFFSIIDRDPVCIIFLNRFVFSFFGFNHPITYKYRYFCHRCLFDLMIDIDGFLFFNQEISFRDLQQVSIELFCCAEFIELK